MSKTAWSIPVSTAFAIALTFTPIPDAWRQAVVGTAWAAVVICSIGWYRAHRREASAPRGSVTLNAIAESVRSRQAAQSSKQPEFHAKRRDVLDKAIDFIREERLQLEKKRSHLPADTFSAIVTARADQLTTEDDLVWVCDQIAGPHRHPFFLFGGQDSPVIQGEWLEFIQAFRNAATTSTRATAAWQFAITHWRGKQRWLDRHHAPMRDIESAGEPQEAKPDAPLESAADRPKLVLLNQGVASNPDGGTCFFFTVKNVGAVAVQKANFSFVIQTTKLAKPPVVQREPTSQPVIEGTQRTIKYSFPRVDPAPAYIVFYVSYVGDGQQTEWDNAPVFLIWRGVKDGLANPELEYLRDEEINRFKEYLRKHEIPRPLL